MLKKFNWLFWVIILAGFIIGMVVGEALKANGDFAFLAQGFEIGLINPFTFSVGLAGITFGFFIKMNVGGAIGIILAALVYKAIF